MGCAEEVAASEAAYLAALGRLETATLESDVLILAGGGVELRFRRLPPAPTGQLIDMTWILESLTTATTATPSQGDEASLRLDSNGTPAARPAAEACRAACHPGR